MLIFAQIGVSINMEEEDLKCSLCLDFFESPVRITTCGHDFCGKCLAGAVQAEELQVKVRNHDMQVFE